MNGSARRIRWGVRIACLAGAVLLVLGGPLPGGAARVLPVLSPLATFSSALASREWFLPLYWLAPAAVLTALAVWRGRWFCRWMCPAGTVYALASSNKPAARRLVRGRWNAWLFWMTLGASAVGYPLWLVFDPLSTSSRTFAWLNGGITLASLVPGLILPVFLVVGLFQPMAWCSNVCPLGYAFTLLDHRGGSGRFRFRHDRRLAVKGLVAGGVLAALAPRVPITAGHRKWPALLPPGSRPPEDFSSLCSRCGACIEACPTGILRLQWNPDAPLSQWFQPELNPDAGACEEFCQACTRVCPTGAILPLDEETKRNLQIGIARVYRGRCLAWRDGEHCMVCDEYCPYNAIKTILSDEGIPQPEVDPDTCRGCGYCQLECPAERGKAILVTANNLQRPVPNPD